MGYAIVLEDDATAVLKSLSTDEAEAVFDGIDRLALQPTLLSEPGAFPHSGFQDYTFRILTDGIEREVTIPFCYSQDETELHIMRILIT